jgi:hypothetical protein
MFVFCVLFGFAMIANTQPAGDGGWFWHSTFLLEGKHLYADMHLAMQPLFVLERAWCLALLGKGWLVLKVPAALHVVAYCLGLLLLVRSSRLSDGGKAIVLGCAFFVSICFEGYQFDDFHVVADCFQVYSLVVLLRLWKIASVRRGLVLCAVLGMLSGLALTTRLNDGAALGVGVAVAIFCLAPAKRLLSVVLCGVAAALTVVLVVKLTGDSLHDYAYYSILHAAGSKGGTNHVLLYPFHLPVNTWRWLRDGLYRQTLLYTSAVALSWVFLLRPALHRRGWRELGMAAGGTLIVLLPLRQILIAFTGIIFVLTLSAVGVLVCYGFGLLIAVRFLRWQFTRGEGYAWDRREILFLTPLGQLASGSMSTGGHHMGLYGPIGMMILLLAICSPIRSRAEWPRLSLLAVATLLICSAAYNKVEMPYSWHSYREPAMAVGRQWYHHPDYGPMIIDRDLLKFIAPVCNAVDADKSQAELLSLPFPYANYFCSVPPWHGYVQTFFDTSSKETIQTVMEELEKSPPKWILYQRQLDNLAMHESVFNHGQPLQHRYLDQMIEHKIDDGEWHVVYRSAYADRPELDTSWVLMRTR